MNINLRIPHLNLTSNLPITVYQIFEFTGAYDNCVIEKRLRKLRIGFEIYGKKGYSNYQFQRFHRRKQASYKFVRLLFILLICIVFGIGLYLIKQFQKDALIYLFIFSLMCIVIGLVKLSRGLFKRKIDSNILNINKLLMDISNLDALMAIPDYDAVAYKIFAKKSFGIEYNEILFSENITPAIVEFEEEPFSLIFEKERITEGIFKEDVPTNLIIEDVASTLNIQNDENLIIKERGEPVTLKNEVVFLPKDNNSIPTKIFDFHSELVWISQQKNLFNGMPMQEVIDFFLVICCDECRHEVSNISQIDFILFLKSAFLGFEKQGQIKITEVAHINTISIFYQFFKLSYTLKYDYQRALRYKKMLLENFRGFDSVIVNNNFRCNNEKRLPNLKIKYKSALQKLQPLQTTKIN